MKKISIIILSLTLWSCGNKNQQSSTQLKSVVYETIGNESLESEKTFNGSLQSGTENELSFRTNGLITFLKVKNGEKVKKGQVLGRVDTKDISLSYDKAKNAVSSTKSQMNTAKSNLDRIKQLYQANGASLSDLEQAKNAYNTAESNYNTAVKAQNIQASQFDYAKIVAPTDGIVTAVNASENEFAKAGTPIIVMNSEGGDLEILVNVPEAYISKIKNAMEVTLLVNDQNFEGTVTEVAFAADQSLTYPVTIKIEKPSDDLRPGMPAQATFNFKPENEELVPSQLLVPTKAVGNDETGDFVFNLINNDDGSYIAKKVNVTLGELKNDGFVVQSGLQHGDIVATAGLRSLYDGMIVNLKN